jgi:FKBP-type peptidyl-prolyl cis-trans isomerase
MNAALAAKMKAQLESKKRPAESQNAASAKKVKTEDGAKPSEKVSTPSKSEAKPEVKKESKPATPEAPKGKQIQTMGRIQYIDTVVGNGPKAEKGKRCVMHYEGRLKKNNKVFDKSSSPFTFRLGVGEVIKGWDVGVSTMKVGGQRTLIIPSDLAYGKKGAGKDIPPNSDLIFDVKLLAVK